MGLFFRSYLKEGPGVSPDEPQKRSFFRFFSLFGRKFSHFIRANLLYCVSLIPTFVIVFFLMSYITVNSIEPIYAQVGDESGTGTTMLTMLFSLLFSLLYVSIMGGGPVTAGITYVMRNFAREEHAWIWSDFKDNVKSNFKQSSIVFVTDIIVVLLLFVASYVYKQIGGTIGCLRYFLYVIGIMFALMHMYIYPLMVTFELPLKDLYKNALIFAFGKLPSNLFVALVLTVIHVVFPVALVLCGGKYFMLCLFVFVIAELLILPIFSAFLVNFNVYPKMKKYMLDVVEKRKSENGEDIAEQ